jgi:deazaflavin-dependent oxidoreductase (nitroreductase family)
VSSGAESRDGRPAKAEVVGFAQASGLQRAVRQFASTGPGSWLASRLLPRVDPYVFRLTRRTRTLSSVVAGLPIVFLTTIGARTGARRTSLVLGFPTDGGLVVIASNFGQAVHPAWYYNLQTNPEGEVFVNGRTWRFRAVEAEGDERDRIWREALTIYPGWASYERRATRRRIAVFVLEPH